MPPPSNPNRIFRFGLYELNGATGELRKEGKPRPKLQGQPLDVLLQLLDRPGEVVTREELRRRLWPADTFVDYDHSLNAAVNKAREALSDSADNPRFIQTIPRRGYRFIASVEAAHGGGNAKTKTGEHREEENRKTDSQAAQAANDTTVLSHPDDLPAVRSNVVRPLFALIQVMYLSFYVASLVSLRETARALEQMPQYSKWLFVVILATALAGIPVRLYLLAAAAFGDRRLGRRFRKLFPILFPFDELWALSPLLLADRIGIGLALAATAALLYVPFSQRSLLLMESNRTESAAASR